MRLEGVGALRGVEQVGGSSSPLKDDRTKGDDSLGSVRPVVVTR